MSSDKAELIPAWGRGVWARTHHDLGEARTKEVDGRRWQRKRLLGMIGAKKQALRIKFKAPFLSNWLFEFQLGPGNLNNELPQAIKV
jgi:hypothetical protein